MTNETAVRELLDLIPKVQPREQQALITAIHIMLTEMYKPINFDDCIIRTGARNNE